MDTRIKPWQEHVPQSVQYEVGGALGPELEAVVVHQAGPGREAGGIGLCPLEVEARGPFLGEMVGQAALTLTLPGGVETVTVLLSFAEAMRLAASLRAVVLSACEAWTGDAVPG